MDDFDRIINKLQDMVDGLPEDLKAAGEAAAEDIVKSTLSGVGAGDSPFEGYSDSYLKRLESAGASKATVDLRGVLPKGRPATGLVDSSSEMSADLISVEVRDGVVWLIYKPREKDHMVYHNEGRGNQPKRVWFTVDRSSTRQALMDTLRQRLEARLRSF